MTSRERVRTVFAHEEPDHVPCWCGASPGFLAKAQRQLGLETAEQALVRFGDDFRRVWARYAGPPERSPDQGLPSGAACRTVFGVVHKGCGCGMPINPPLAGASLAEIEAYAWPEPDWMDVSTVRRQALAWRGEHAILGGDWSPFWHDANEVVGMERLMILMREDPAVVDAVMSRAADYYLEVNRRIFDAAADAIDVFFIGNDFGSQAGPLIGETAFRRFVLPHLRRLCGLGHDYGLKVMMHCCGGFAPLIPAMIEAGLDGLQALQPSARGMEPARLKADFGDKLVLCGGIDSQHALIEGNPATVRDITRRTLEILKPGGGYILSASHDFILEETPVENVLAMFDAGKEFGVYARPTAPPETSSAKP